MSIKKIRFIEPANNRYRVSPVNLYTYDKYIRTPSTGLLTLTTIVKEIVDDTLMYSESISKVKWSDIFDADIVFIGIFTMNAPRGYEIARYIKENSSALVVMGGLHASLNYAEAVEHCNYVLLGEGDESILEFINAYENNTPLDFPGMAYKDDNNALIYTGDRIPPHNIDTIPNRYLMYNFKKMAGHNTIWAQVHASRGCPHDCDYCALVKHFGRKVRTRSPENVVEDIRQGVAFFEERLFKRVMRILWITDDNFFANRKWAIEVLNAIIDSGIKYNYTIQARYEVGLDDEMLVLLKKAGFVEVAFGIEFIDDESFELYHKKSTREDIIKAIHNTQRHGLRTRGLFILGADNHTKGIGTRLAAFILENNIVEPVIQSMYFVPGTPVYEQSKNKLIHTNWEKYTGHVVHYPMNMTPAELQQELITASAIVYSRKQLFRALFSSDSARSFSARMTFLGEYFWQKSIRRDLKRELKELKNFTEKP
ncbi:MAG: B12-binding domain-containing radical SAM protein [Oscillospiraceae bacterium]|nr:B12-binding domain-containing radical SAM protein [Oscillospiraceae bacterium]